MESTARFKPGDFVEAQNYAAPGWRPATVDRVEFYLGREGYYVTWVLPAETPMWVSRGGWMPGHSVRLPFSTYLGNVAAAEGDL